MLGDTTAPRRRKLPVLGMTTVGLAVGAGSLGLYRGTAAVPTGPPDQPTWTTAEVRSPAPPPDEKIVQVAAQEPASPLPVVPVLPALPSLPTLTSAALPEPPPLPRPVDVSPAPVTPVLPVVPAMPVPVVPVFVKPVEVVPLPVPVKAAEVELAPIPRQYTEPTAIEAKPLAPVAQPVQLAAPVRPIAPAPPDFYLPQSQPGFNVNSTPVVPSERTAPGTLTSLSPEHPGESAVIPSYQALKAAALGMALAATPVSAAETPTKTPAAETPTKEAAKEDVVGDLKKLVEKLRQDVELEKKFRELTDDTVKGKLNKESGKTEPGLLTKFDELDARMKRLEEALKKVDVNKFEEAIARLETKLTDMSKTTTTQTQKPDASPKAMPGPVTGGPALFVSKATVRIVNEYPVPISMMVNGTSHRVEPSGSKSVEVPSGMYSYELLHAGSQATTATIKENDSVTLRIK